MHLSTGILKVALTEPPKPRLERLEDGVEVSFRAWPHDLDIDLHMNNARYLIAMEVARWAFLIRAGLLGAALRERWAMVNAAQTVSFYQPHRSDLPAPLRGWNQVSDALLAEKRADDAARSDAAPRDHPEERPAVHDR